MACEDPILACYDPNWLIPENSQIVGIDSGSKEVLGLEIIPDSPIYKLGLSQPKKIITPDGQVYYIKAIIDSKFEDVFETRFLGITDTGRRQMLAHNLLSQEFPNMILLPDAKIVSFDDGTSILISKGIDAVGISKQHQ